MIFLTQSLSRLKQKDDADPKAIMALEHLLAKENEDVLTGLASFLGGELRDRAGESDEAINRKVLAALAQGLQVIFCCGENREARENNETFKLLERQIRMGLEGVPQRLIHDVVIAYEPLWAIGVGANPATHAQISQVHDFIRNLIMDLHGEQFAASIRILYGGNVKPDNIADIMTIAGVDGALVGGASLKATDFGRIVRFGLID